MAAIDVMVLGAGWAGLAVARRLRDRGVTVRVVDPRGACAGASGRSLGIVLPCPAEHPHRLEAALGTARAAELVAFVREGLPTLPGFGPVGVRWRAMGTEIGEIDASVAAARRIGLGVERTHDGFHLTDGGRVDLDVLRAALATEVHPDPVEADVIVHATGWETTSGWIADKLTPVRWQAARFAGPKLPFPVMTQHATVAWDGALDAVGARWATPHMEVGETEPVPAPAVDAMLERLTRHAFPEAGARAGSWAGIVGESCDNLPFFGPIPGRPREIACAGFGFWGLPVIWRAAAAIAAGLLGDASAEVPRTLSTGRFR